MRAWLLLVGLLAAALRVAPPASGAPDAQPAEVVERVVLEHFTGAGMVRLLTSSIPPPGKTAEVGLRSADSLVPRGVRGLIGFPGDGTLAIVGEPEAVHALQAAARMADVKFNRAGNDEVSVTLAPARAALPEVSAAALKLPQAGRANIEQKRLTLAGKPDWIYRALRTALKLELAALASGPSGQP
ncbi:MAG: hypothetical protein ACO1SX_15300 [Actinomycetota bacterium]